MSVTSPPEERRLSYGWLRFRPTWLQFINTPKWFLFFLSQYFFTQSFVINGLYPGMASTIQKRFAFTSYKVGMILSSYNIAAVILTPLVSYFGGSRKKPVFCGCGLFTMAAGFFIFMLPHFISSPYQAGVSTDNNVTFSNSELCAGNLTDFGAKTDCSEENGGDNLYYALFILGMIVAGIGSTPLYALGVPYVDENVKAKVSPMYLGIFVAFGILGAAVGFVSTSFFLSLFVEVGVETSLTPQDTHWVGNWWLGFTIFGGLSVFWSLWLFAFPKEFPLTKKRREDAKREGSTNEDSAVDAVGYTRLKDLPKATKLTFSRLPFVFITIGVCMEDFVITSVTTFGPKILEAQFYQPAERAALLYGLVAVPVALLGNMLGAYINKRLNLNLSGAAKMCFIVACMSLVCTCFLYIKCDTIQIVGVNTPYVNSSSSVQLDSKCNQACNCTEVRFDPVCGGPLTYFSPCHAGCGQFENRNKSSPFYETCTCAESKAHPIGKVEKGACQVDCGLQLVLFLLVLSAITLMTFLNDTPALIVTLRSVAAGQQSYALGLQLDLVKIIGSIPGPIIFGALIDKTCILWDTRCDEKGFCLEYDHKGLSLVLLGVLLVCKAITTTTFFLSWYFSRRQAETNNTRTTIDMAL